MPVAKFRIHLEEIYNLYQKHSKMGINKVLGYQM